MYKQIICTLNIPTFSTLIFFFVIKNFSIVNSRHKKTYYQWQKQKNRLQKKQLLKKQP
jgi:hypothetical protein